MKPATRRTLKGLALAVGGLLVGFVIAGYVLLQRSLPVTEGTIALDGPHHEITITFDSLGIPQIWAHNERDALFALGYQHAADRMFQMELVRRLSQGRFSEMLGQITLDTDRQQRRIGHARLGRQALTTLSDDNRRRLQAYADGVNAYANTCRSVPFEFRLLPTDFEPWTIYDCLTILSFQTWYSDALQNRDRYYLELSNMLSAERFRELIPQWPDWAPVTVTNKPIHGHRAPFRNEPIRYTDLRSASSSNQVADETAISPKVPASAGSIKKTPCAVASGLGPPKADCDLTQECLSGNGGRSHESTDVASQDLTQQVQRDLSTSPMVDTSPVMSLPASIRMTDASNSWVVAPQRSHSGKAMLAADPHLELGRLPQFWYAIGLHVEDSSHGVLGITVPGLPFVVMGHNGAAAWSFTAGGVDITDYYEEKVDPDDSLMVLTPLGYQPFEIIVDTIYCSDATPVEMRTKLTRRRPIMIENGGKQYSLKWAGQDVDMNTAVDAGFALSRTLSFDQFRSTVTQLGALNANYMFADSAGNVGYQLAAPLPIRGENDGHLPARGWQSADEWQGYYPLSWTPFDSNPEQGWLASCNNRPDRSRRYDGSFAADRILRLTELLAGDDDVTVDDMMSWQMDQHDRYLLRWRDLLAATLDSIGEPDRAAEVRDWNGQSSTESQVTPMMVVFLERLKRLTFESRLTEKAAGVSRLTLDRLYLDEPSTWLDEDATRDQVAQQAAREMVDALFSDQDANGERSWGDMQSLTMHHPMAAVPILNWVLDLEFGPRRRGGTPGSLNSSYYHRHDDTTYSSVVGPSWRFVIDFADVDGATMVLPAGNSGNPVSRHFFDFNKLWANGGRWNVPFSRERVFERAASVLTLAPEEGLQ